MDRAKTLADRALGSWPATALPRQATRQQLRILAYHSVLDVDAFRKQIAMLVTHYEPVSAAAVGAALQGLGRLPDYAVWVTFDDGDPSVVENALPVLHQHGISGTVFVCPGLVDTASPYWWDVVDIALALGESCELDGRLFSLGDSHALTSQLKVIQDDHRREVVAALADSIVERQGHPAERRQVTTSQLRDFVAAGGSVGNHTWDHPCLDMADKDVQRAQIVRANAWLAARFPDLPDMFAYPNGNHTSVAEEVLRELGYTIGLLFDHRLVRGRSAPLVLSRLRVNDYTTPARFAAILAGVHPALHALRGLK